MKWKEVCTLAPGTPLTHFGGRKAILIELHKLNEISGSITVQYLDGKHERERCNPSEFDRGLKTPTDTVARGEQ
jgi:hypothetical protein